MLSMELLRWLVGLGDAQPSEGVGGSGAPDVKLADKKRDLAR